MTLPPFFAWSVNLQAWMRKLRNIDPGPLRLFADQAAFFKERGQAFLLLPAIGIGVLSAYGAILFRYLILLMHTLFFDSGELSLDLFYHLPWWMRLSLPAAGGLAVGLIVNRFAPEVKGSGIPEVIESVALKGGIIRARVLVTKAVAAAVTIGSGGSAGREGPIVHIGSAVGSALGQLLGVPAKHLRTFIACGAAAGIAATFNAPIAGALFAIEVIVADLRNVSMPPIVIAAVVGTVISRYHLGDFPAFRVPVYQMLSPFELLLYAALGLAAGLGAVVFIRLFLSCSNFFDNLRMPGFLKPVLGGLGVGLIALAFPHIYGVGYATINAALWNQLDFGLAALAVLILAKLIATCLTLGSGGSGGIFAPALFLGAILGVIWGQMAQLIFPGATAGPGAYALVGMGAMVSAVTHAPISAILIIFELTNNYRIIPPLMVSCVIAYLLGHQLNPLSIYLAKLGNRGVDLRRKRDINLLKAIDVKQVMDKSPPLIKRDTPFNALLAALLGGDKPFGVVVDEHQVYRGVIELNDIREILPHAESLGEVIIAHDIAVTDIAFVLPHDSLDVAMHIFGKTARDVIAVCNSVKNKQVLGTISKEAVINAYNLRIFQEDLTGGFGSLMDTVQEGRSIEVMGGMHLSKIEVPFSWTGKTLRNLDLRKRLGLEVVMIHREESAGNRPQARPGRFPEADLRLEPGDRLLVIGTPEAIARIRN